MKRIFCDFCDREVFTSNRVNLLASVYIGDLTVPKKEIAVPVVLSFKSNGELDLCIECLGTQLADLGAGIVTTIERGETVLLPRA